MSFLDVDVSSQQGKFVTTVYRKPTFTAVYTDFDSFLTKVHKVGMIYTLAHRCLKICFDWTKLHEELKGIVMQIEKSLRNDHLCVLKVSWKVQIPTIYNFAVTYPRNLLFS